ncbi:16033_t:CDS:10 [Acaulospora morrowiae]|uniref:Vacuolar import and degradation protein 21 n=1 Tax=Acaulospora morrowiae TaxID=94023 RepID=A0A9N9BNP0_9GLOM|nr:16033_t:CDS:10 [Acaulospora morrowiae]
MRSRRSTYTSIYNSSDVDSEQFDQPNDIRDATLSSKGKDTNVAGDGSLTSDIQELRNKVVELRNQELKKILATRDSVLKHLFYMNYMLSKSDSVETYTEIIDNVSEKVDQAKLRDFLQSHKLDLEKIMDPEKSTKSNSSIIVNPNAAIPNTPEHSQSTLPISNNQTPVDQTTQPKKQKRVSLPPVERMVTRAASGAINPKSVDEILKDAERLGGFASSSALSAPPTPVKLNLQPKKQPQQRAASVMSRNGEGRQTANITMGRSFEHAQTRTIDRESLISNYNNQPIYKLFQNPKKALTTEDWTVAREEVKMVRVLERIDHLKNQGLWSFQQIEPFRDPPRPYTHRDYLLDEMVWMQKDFKKERKWKIAAAFHMSRWVMDWHESKDDKERRDALCVKVRIPHKIPSKRNVDERESTQEASSDANDEVKPEPVDDARDLNDLPTNQVKWSSSSDEVMIDVESVDDEASTTNNIDQTKDNDAIIMPPPIAPNVLQNLRQKVTSLSADAFLCCLEGPDGQVYDVDSIFPDLPTYEPLRPSEKDLYIDYIHYSRIMPISKRMYRRPRSDKNVRKRSMSGDSQSSKKVKIEEEDEKESEQDTTSLFSSQDLPINVKAPRPDPETPCIWYPEDDELLMTLAKRFQYNWELVADSWNSTRGGIIGFPRTPWACYQRWAQKDNLSRFVIHENETSNEGSSEILVSDGAIDAPSSSIAGGPSTLINVRPKRDIMPKKIPKPDIPRVRRNSSLLDVMKKSAKKRQDMLLKQSQTRRNNDQPGQVVHQVPGPIELSKLKSENERRYQAHLLEQRQVAALAFQSHVRAPTGLPYGGRPPITTQNQLQAYVMQQQQRQVNTIAVQRHSTQQITSAMTQQSMNFYNNVRIQQAQRAHILQGAQTSSHQNQQQISQQHQQVGQQSPQPPPQSQQPTLQPQTTQAPQQSQQTTQQ